jgi:hypothetical protein
MNHCDCHQWSDEDERIWKLARQQPRTREEWKFLHDAIESYRRLIVDNFRGAQAQAQEKTHD